jgi:hypothetical protein
MNDLWASFVLAKVKITFNVLKTGVTYFYLKKTIDRLNWRKRKYFFVTENIDGFSCPEGQTLGPNGQPLAHPSFPHPSSCQKFLTCYFSKDIKELGCMTGQVCNFTSLSHVYKFNSFFQANRYYKSNQFHLSVIFYKSKSFLQVWFIYICLIFFTSLNRFYKSNRFLIHFTYLDYFYMSK